MFPGFWNFLVFYFGMADFGFVGFRFCILDSWVLIQFLVIWGLFCHQLFWFSIHNLDILICVILFNGMGSYIFAFTLLGEWVRFWVFGLMGFRFWLLVWGF